jgi:hypothetical protein
MPLPTLYCVLGTLFVDAIYFVSVRNKGPSPAAGDTEGESWLAKVWPLAVAGIAYPGAAGAAGGPHPAPRVAPARCPQEVQVSGHRPVPAGTH